MPVWYDTPIVKIEPAAPGVRRFWLEKPAGFEFRAGQFITFDLPIGDKRLQRWRSYSIASAPDDSGLLELCIVRSASGPATQFLFDEAAVGTPLRWKGPDGTFCLPEKIEKDLVFICTGTGIAPFRSMILDLKNSGRAHRNLHLIFGTRQESGILYRSEFEQLARELPDFQYDVALSRQPDWDGWQGYVHQIYMEKYRTPRPDVAFYLCGWSNMIDEAVANLLVGLGYDRTQILYELYG